jgi:hypothetical protein
VVRDDQALSPDEDSLVRQRLDAAVRGLDPARLSILSWRLSERLLRLTDPISVFEAHRPARLNRRPRSRRAHGDREGTWAWWVGAAVLVQAAAALLLATMVLPAAYRVVPAGLATCALFGAALCGVLGWLRVDDGPLVAVVWAPYLLVRDFLDAVESPLDVIDGLLDDIQALARRARRWLAEERMRIRARRAAGGLGPAQLQALVDCLDDYRAVRAHLSDDPVHPASPPSRPVRTAGDIPPGSGPAGGGGPPASAREMHG